MVICPNCKKRISWYFSIRRYYVSVIRQPYITGKLSGGLERITVEDDSEENYDSETLHDECPECGAEISVNDDDLIKSLRNDELLRFSD